MIKKLSQKIKDVLYQQLKQGATAEGLALTCAVGIALALFPALGTTTALCIAVGTAMKLNQPTLQMINYVLAPIQLILIPVFLKLGAWIFGIPAVSVNPKTMIAEFFEAPAQFLADYGIAGLLGIVAWSLVMPIVAYIAYRFLRILFVNFQKMKGA